MTTITSMTNHLQTAGPKTGAKGANERSEEYIKKALFTMGVLTGGAVNKLLPDPVEHLVKQGKNPIDPTVDEKDLIEKGREFLKKTYEEGKDLVQIVKYRIEVYIGKGWDIFELGYEKVKDLFQRGMDCIKENWDKAF